MAEHPGPPARCRNLASNQDGLANATLNLASFRTSLAYSGEEQGLLATNWLNILGRALDTGNLASNQAAMAAGTQTLASYRTSLAYSAEERGVLGTTWANILGRTLDAGNLASNQAAMAAGTETLASFRSVLAFSTEERSTLSATWQNILGRPLDAASMASNQNALAAGTLTLAGFRDGVARSAESQADINTAFLNTTGAGAGAIDYTYWEDQYANGHTQADLRNTLSLYKPTVEAISKAYFEETDVAISLGTLSNYQMEFAGGQTLNGLRAELSTKAFVGLAIDKAWTGETGSSITSADWSYWQAQFANGKTLTNLRQTLSTAPATIAAITAVWLNVTGASINDGNLRWWETEFAQGLQLKDLWHGLAYNYAPTVAALKNTWLGATGQNVSPHDQKTTQKFVEDGADRDDIVTISQNVASKNVMLADAVNEIDPTHGAIPLRTDPYLSGIIDKYAHPTAPFFHSYAAVTVLATFSNASDARYGFQVATDLSRHDPAPGVSLPTALDSPKRAEVFLGLKSLGHIITEWDIDSQSIVNITDVDHSFKVGLVVRQLTLEGNTIYMTTLGEGNNTGQLRAFVNGTFGPGGFIYMDDKITSGLAKLHGFNGIGTGVPGSGSHFLIPDPYFPL